MEFFAIKVKKLLSFFQIALDLGSEYAYLAVTYRVTLRYVLYDTHSEHCLLS